MINVPIVQEDFELPTLPEWPKVWPEWPEEWPEFPWPELTPKTKQHKQMVRNIKTVQAKTKQYKQLFGTDTDLIRQNRLFKLKYLSLKYGYEINKTVKYSLVRVAEDNGLAGESFRLAVCLPKTCTTKQAIDTLFINTTAVGLKFTDEFCRLKNDKPFLPGDYAAM